MTQEITDQGTMPEEDFLDFASPVEEAPQEVAPPTEVAQEQPAPQEQAAQEPTPSTSEPAQTPQNVPSLADSPTAEENEVDALRKQVNDLMAIISQNTLTQQPAKEEPKDQAQIADAFAGLKKDATKVSTFDFFGDADHVEVIGDKEKLNGLLNQVMSISYQAAVMAARDSIMRDIPSVVSTTAQQQMAISDITKDFYTNNPDLEPYKAAVSMAAQQIYNENPKLELGALLAEAGRRTRDVLRLRSTPSRKNIPAHPAGPALGGNGIDRTAQPTALSPQEQQILDLLDF